MATFLQIFVINLIVSADNIGVIALATRNLPEQEAARARKAGVWLSLLLKFLFIGIIGFLFSISWLHIRVLGGIMLLYVTFNMIRQSKADKEQPGQKVNARDSFLLAIVTIIAADVSMSLDNVIAVLSIVSSDQQPLDLSALLLIFAALLASVPILLWFSTAISALMERFRILTCLCGGYLAYIAVNMMCEDERLVIFFNSINFQLVSYIPIICGAAMFLYGLFMSGEESVSAQRRNVFLSVCPFTILHSFLTVIAICLLATNPIHEGHILTVQLLYDIVPSGANAVFTLSKAIEVPLLCTTFYLAAVAWNDPESSVLSLFWHSCKNLLLLLILQLMITTFGLTINFGFGQITPTAYLIAFVLQYLLLASYIAVFCLLSTVIKTKAAFLAGCILYLILEAGLAEICIHTIYGRMFAGLLPDFYIELLPVFIHQPAFVINAAAVSVFFIAASLRLGITLKKRNRAI